MENDFIFNHDFVKDKIVNPSLGVIWSKFYKTSLIKENKIRFSIISRQQKARSREIRIKENTGIRLPQKLTKSLWLIGERL